MSFPTISLTANTAMKIHLSLLCLLILAIPLSAGTLVDSLLSGYGEIQSLSCEVRRDSESGDNKVRTLSRVYFQKPDRLHVESVAPLSRRIVADGTNFFSYVAGDPKGFSRPVARLERDMLISLRKVPATAMDHLLRLEGAPETNLPPTAGFPVRRGYDTGKMTAVLSLDTSNRLACIEFFADREMTQKTARTEYSHFSEALPGVWLSRLHKTVVWMGGGESRETNRFDNLSVNKPIAPNLFNASLFFQKVDFVANIEQMYE